LESSVFSQYLSFNNKFISSYYRYDGPLIVEVVE
jgi:hypothetical protein